jgi:hypothetical protein
MSSAWTDLGGPTSSRRRVLILLPFALVGASLFAIILGTFWLEAGDNLAYWIAGDRLARGEPVYAPPELAFEPFAFHYPPPVAQALAPVAVLLPPLVFIAIYRGLLLLAVWYLAGRRALPMFALLAALPVAIALRIENVELFMAVALVLGLQRWPWLFVIGAIVKVSPGLGLVYLALQRRWRDVALSVVVGVVVVGVSYVLAPDLWPAWLESISGRADMVGNSLIPLPYWVRAVAGFVLAVVGGLRGRRTGELLLVVGATVANPGLSLQGFAVLAAAIPIWRAGPDGIGGASRRPGATA